MKSVYNIQEIYQIQKLEKMLFSIYVPTISHLYSKHAFEYTTVNFLQFLPLIEKAGLSL